MKGLRKAIDKILLNFPEHNRIDEQEEILNEICDAIKSDSDKAKQLMCEEFKVNTGTPKTKFEDVLMDLKEYEKTKIEELARELYIGRQAGEYSGATSDENHAIYSFESAEAFYKHLNKRNNG